MFFPTLEFGTLGQGYITLTLTGRGFKGRESASLRTMITLHGAQRHNSWLVVSVPLMRPVECRSADQLPLLLRRHPLPYLICLSIPKLICSRLDDAALARITLARTYGVKLRMELQACPPCLDSISPRRLVGCTGLVQLSSMMDVDRTEHVLIKAWFLLKAQASISYPRGPNPCTRYTFGRISGVFLRLAWSPHWH